MKPIYFPQDESLNPANSAGIMVDLKFEDIHHLLEAIKSWDIHFKQMDKGSLNSRLKQILFPEFQLGLCTLDKQIDQMGTSPPGFWTFAFATGGRIIWKGIEKEMCDLIIYPPGGEIHCQSWSGFHVATLSIPESKMEQICEEEHFSSAMRIIRENDLVRVDKRYMHEFRKQLLQLLNHFPSGAQEIPPGLYHTIYEDLPRQLLQMIEGPGEGKEIFTSALRKNAVRNVREYLHHTKKANVHVTDLYQAAGVSERTLQYAFKENYGLSPKQYLKNFLMNKMHLALSRSNPEKTSITELAHQYGFWHMGQFSKDYHRMFGCLPSATLRK